LIAIDDGSTNNSLAILHKFMEKDSRIKVFHKDNGGATSARIFATNYCTGNFIFELDADDTIGENSFEKMLFAIEKHNCDAVIGELLFAKNNKIFPFDTQHKHKIGNIINAPDIIEHVLQGKLSTFVLWRAEIYKKGYKFDNLNFTSFSSDEFLSTLLFGLCKSVVFSEGKYFYKLHQNSITHTIKPYRFDVIKTTIAYIDFCKQNNISEKTTHFVIQTAIGIWVHLRIFLIKYHKKFSKEDKNHINNLLKFSAIRLKSEKTGKIICFKNFIKIILFKFTVIFYIKK
jgi:glycosyltransferase involved in cell wall biosynthesis